MNRKIFLRSEGEFHYYNVKWFIAVLWDVVNKKFDISASFDFSVSIVKPQNFSSAPAKTSLVRLFLQVFSKLAVIPNEFYEGLGFSIPN